MGAHQKRGMCAELPRRSPRSWRASPCCGVLRCFHRSRFSHRGAQALQAAAIALHPCRPPSLRDQRSIFSLPPRLVTRRRSSRGMALQWTMGLSPGVPQVLMLTSPCSLSPASGYCWRSNYSAIRLQSFAQLPNAGCFR